MKKLFTFLFVMTFTQIGYSNVAFSEEVGGYKIGKWYKTKKDKQIRYRLTWNKYNREDRENVPTYIMETSYEATPDQVAAPILDYARYTRALMPRMLESTRLHLWEHVSLDWVEGKQRKAKKRFTDVSLVIMRFALNIDYLPDAHYTLALVNYKEPATGIIHIRWIQYDEETYKNIKKVKIKRYPDHPAFPLRLPKPDDTDKYPNTNADLYGSWMLVPLVAQNQTFVHYESYADPGWWGRRVMGTVVENSLIDMIKILGIVRKNIKKD